MGIDVVGSVGDAQALLLAVALDRPDVALIDIKMPPTHTDEGLTAAMTIRDQHPSVAVLVLSHYLDSRYALRLLDAHPGAVGYLLKERISDIVVLVDALRRVADGECVIDPTIVSRLLHRPRTTGKLDRLTDREREVLALMAEGHSNQAHLGPAHAQSQDRGTAHRAHLRQARPRRLRRPSPPRSGRAGNPPDLIPATTSEC